MKVNTPKNLQGVLWSKDINLLDVEKDKRYIIHQVLAYGTWEHIIWLFKIYKPGEIKTVFSEQPEKDYSEKSFNFAKNILLEIPQEIDKSKYVKTYPRFIEKQPSDDTG